MLENFFGRFENPESNAVMLEKIATDKKTCQNFLSKLLPNRHCDDKEFDAGMGKLYENINKLGHEAQIEIIKLAGKSGVLGAMTTFALYQSENETAANASAMATVLFLVKELLDGAKVHRNIDRANMVARNLRPDNLYNSKI